MLQRHMYYKIVTFCCKMSSRLVLHVREYLSNFAHTNTISHSRFNTLRYEQSL